MEFYHKYTKDIPPDCVSGYLTNDNDIYYVNQKEVINNRGLHNDIVYLKDQEVIGIKERTTVHLVGILYLNTNVKYGFTKKNIPYYKFSPISQKYPDFIVPSKHKIKEKLYCVISFNKWEVTNKSPIGQIESMIGPIGLLSNEIDMLLYRTSIYPKKKKIEYLTLPSSNEKPEYNTFSIGNQFSLYNKPCICSDEFNMPFQSSDESSTLHISLPSSSSEPDEPPTSKKALVSSLPTSFTLRLARISRNRAFSRPRSA